MKPLEWIASSKKDLKAMPDEVQDDVGYQKIGFKTPSLRTALIIW
ncbi:MAG: hypothetical protein ACBR12_00405 [Microcoleus sp.]